MNKSQAELRHEQFLDHATHAREIGDAALSDIDKELLENERLFTNWIERGDSRRDPLPPDRTRVAGETS